MASKVSYKVSGHHFEQETRFMGLIRKYCDQSQTMRKA